MRKIGFDFPIAGYFATTTKFAAFILTGLALVPVAVVALATAFFGTAGTYGSLALSVVYLVGLGWFVSEVIDPELEETTGKPMP